MPLNVMKRERYELIVRCQDGTRMLNAHVTSDQPLSVRVVTLYGVRRGGCIHDAHAKWEDLLSYIILMHWNTLEYNCY